MSLSIRKLYAMTKSPKELLIHCLKESIDDKKLLREKIDIVNKIDNIRIKSVLKLMLDSSGKVGLKFFKKKHNLKFHRVPGDGDCQFTAMAHQIYGSKKYSNLVRYLLTDYIEKNPDEFKIFYAPNEEYNSFEEWLDAIKYFEWGDEFTIKAAKEYYNRPILVYDMMKKTCTYHVPEGVQHKVKSLSECPEVLLSDTIILIYNGENHYDSVTHKDKKMKYLKPTSNQVKIMKDLTKQKEEMFQYDSSSDEESDDFFSGGYSLRKRH